jgi:ornithine cyclodeaminase/alanine dehydrogenase-like protein (mu-crystallin family)
MIVFLSESDVQAAITMAETLGIVEAAFRDYALGQATLLPRVSQTLPELRECFAFWALRFPSRRCWPKKH